MKRPPPLFYAPRRTFRFLPAENAAVQIFFIEYAVSLQFVYSRRAFRRCFQSGIRRVIKAQNSAW